MSYVYESIPTQVCAFKVERLGHCPFSGDKTVWFKGHGTFPQHLIKDNESLEVGDYVIWLDEDDIYRCPKAVFEAKYRRVFV
ncbi:hypothetical protein [Aliamphritea ceti]|uniref:hypothetical protein n=1 Tax=Aliamphritea ceti TaxID=1524258 RepID=UPI0021C40116|nr:hypothetical protein [Aliamphritea ceti]